MGAALRRRHRLAGSALLGGEGSDFRRKTSYNGEQQIYVDPRYGGRETTPLGLDPLKVQDGILSIVASRSPRSRFRSGSTIP
jgi:hypothetical protein